MAIAHTSVAPGCEQIGRRMMVPGVSIMSSVITQSRP